MTDIATIESLARSEGVSYGVYVATNHISYKTCPMCGGIVWSKRRKYCCQMCYLRANSAQKLERYHKGKKAHPECNPE